MYKSIDLLSEFENRSGIKRNILHRKPTAVRLSLLGNYFYRVFRSQADWTFILPSELPCERAAPLAEKNTARRHHILKSLAGLHNEHRICLRLLLLPMVIAEVLYLLLQCNRWVLEEETQMHRADDKCVVT
jgi:hypothetical protein